MWKSEGRTEHRKSKNWPWHGFVPFGKESPKLYNVPRYDKVFANCSQDIEKFTMPPPPANLMSHKVCAGSQFLVDYRKRSFVLQQSPSINSCLYHVRILFPVFTANKPTGIEKPNGETEGYHLCVKALLTTLQLPHLPTRNHYPAHHCLLRC